jgi:hypothetical protein
LYNEPAYYGSYLPVADGPGTFLFLLFILAIFIFAFLWLLGVLGPTPCPVPDPSIKTKIEAIFLEQKSDAVTARAHDAIHYLEETEKAVLKHLEDKGVFS